MQCGAWDPPRRFSYFFMFLHSLGVVHTSMNQDTIIEKYLMSLFGKKITFLENVIFEMIMIMIMIMWKHDNDNDNVKTWYLHTQHYICVCNKCSSHMKHEVAYATHMCRIYNMILRMKYATKSKNVYPSQSIMEVEVQ